LNIFFPLPLDLISFLRQLEVYGDYFYSFVMKNGYEGLLGVQGETVFNFLCNINRLHKHLAHNLPQLIAPEVLFLFLPDPMFPSKTLTTVAM
jgi:hypothetical protein